MVSNGIGTQYLVVAIKDKSKLSEHETLKYVQYYTNRTVIRNIFTKQLKHSERTNGWWFYAIIIHGLVIDSTVFGKTIQFLRTLQFLFHNNEHHCSVCI